jgi:hypothetical protein
MKIKVANYYSDGHHSTMQYTVPDIDLPSPLDVDNGEHLDQLWDVLYGYTGDGHAADNAALGCLYEVEILDATDPRLIGLINEYA